MLFFIPLCDSYAPVILPYFRSFMLMYAFCFATGRFMLVFCYARGKSNSQFSCLLERYANPHHPRVCSRQTVLCVWGCGVYGLHPKMSLDGTFAP